MFGPPDKICVTLITHCSTVFFEGILIKVISMRQFYGGVSLERHSNPWRHRVLLWEQSVETSFVLKCRNPHVVHLFSLEHPPRGLDSQTPTQAMFEVTKILDEFDSPTRNSGVGAFLALCLPLCRAAYGGCHRQPFDPRWVLTNGFPELDKIHRIENLCRMQAGTSTQPVYGTGGCPTPSARLFQEPQAKQSMRHKNRH